MHWRLSTSLLAGLMAGIAIALLFLAGSSTSSPAQAADQTITFTCCSYSSSSVNVQPGETVTWTGDFAGHPLKFDNDPAFTLSTGSSYSRTFPTAGVFNFYCQIHGSPGLSGMAGRVIVGDPPTSTPTATPTTGTGPTATPSPTSTLAPPLNPAGPDARIARMFTAILLSANEVPTNTSTEVGRATMLLSEDFGSISYVLTSTITDTTQAHIHRGPRGVNGPVIQTLATGVFSRAEGTVPLSPTHVADLFAGRLYVNVHSDEFVGGEIRGQLVGHLEFWADLKGSNEIPLAGSDTGSAFLSISPDLSTMHYRIETTVLTPTGAHIHPGPAGITGPVVIPFPIISPTNGLFTGSIPFNPAYLPHLLNDGAYVNVHSAQFPPGAARGQVHLIPGYQALLGGAFETPSNNSANSGIASFLAFPGKGKLAYVISHTVSAATAAHIHVGYPGQAGPVVDPVVTTNTTGTLTLTERLRNLLDAGQIYVNIHTAALPGGEIRGQVTPPRLFWAILNGAQETPPVTTSASGRSFVLLNGAETSVIYVVTSTVANATVAHIHTGLAGVAGPPIVTLATGSFTVTAGTGTLTPTQVLALRAGNAYVNVHSPGNPAGEIRGQLIPPGTIHIGLSVDGYSGGW